MKNNEMKNLWEEVIHNSDKLAESIKDLFNDYLDMTHDMNNNEVDETMWVHIDTVNEERDDYESKIMDLECELGEREDELRLLKNYIVKLEMRLYDMEVSSTKQKSFNNKGKNNKKNKKYGNLKIAN